MQKFKQRYDILHLKACGEKLPLDSEATEKYVTDFAKLVKDQELSPEQIYDADKTSVFWRSLPCNLLSGTEEKVVYRVEESTERLTVLMNTMLLASTNVNHL